MDEMRSYGRSSFFMQKLKINTVSIPDSDELNNNNVPSPQKLLVKTKTYADITKRVDIMVMIGEVKRNQNDQSSRNVQQMNSPFLTMNFDIRFEQLSNVVTKFRFVNSV